MITRSEKYHTDTQQARKFRLRIHRDLRRRYRAGRHRNQEPSRGQGIPAGRVLLLRERRALCEGDEHRDLLLGQLERPRAYARPQAPAHQAGTPPPEPGGQDQGAHHRGGTPLYRRKRKRQAPHRPRTGKEGVRQAADHQGEGYAKGDGERLNHLPHFPNIAIVSQWD